VFKEADAQETIRKIRDRFCQLTGRKRIALYAGRWSFEKEIGKLIAPLPADFGLIIVGDGPARTTVEGYHNPQRGIVALPDGMVSQHTLRQFYKAADVNVSASSFETFGMTVLEAQLCGTPSIVQNAGGFRDQLTTVMVENVGVLTDYAAIEVTRGPCIFFLCGRQQVCVLCSRHDGGGARATAVVMERPHSSKSISQ
jgi:glycosyltransferase involved in cell wall biosynthesis